MTIVLLVGLFVGVYLVQRQQQIKSRASTPERTNLLQAFEFKDANGNVLQCTPAQDSEPVTCTTSTLDINVRLKDSSALTP